MNQLNRVYDATRLKRTTTYQIEGRLYRYAGSDPYASPKSPQYRFVPLAGQKRKSDLILNHRKLMLNCYEVEGMKVSSNTTATNVGVQLSLF